MTGQVVFDVRCPEERAVVGRVVVAPGAALSSATLLAAYRPVHDRYALQDQQGRTAVRDGEQVICPACGGALALCDPDESPGESGTVKGVFLIPGNVRVT